MNNTNNVIIPVYENVVNNENVVDKNVEKNKKKLCKNEKKECRYDKNYVMIVIFLLIIFIILFSFVGPEITCKRDVNCSG